MGVLLAPCIEDIEMTMSHCTNPYTDFGFKKLLGEETNKDLFADFINAVLLENDHIVSAQWTAWRKSSKILYSAAIVIALPDTIGHEHKQ